MATSDHPVGSFAALVEASGRVGATSKRKEKIETLGELLAPLEPHDAKIAIGLLVGEPRQGRIGVGWSAVTNVAYDPARSSDLQLTDIDEAIENLQATSGAGSVARRSEQLSQLFGAATETEVDFLKRLFVGEIRQGALGGLLADAVAKAHGIPATVVRRAAMLSGDLGHAASVAAADGRKGLEAIGLAVLTGVQPMLAATSTDVNDALEATGEASVEWKLDGARIQVHRSGQDVRIFTRNLNDITERLPETVALVRSLPCESVVLDGEVLFLNADGRPEAFQDSMSKLSQDDRDGPTTSEGLQSSFFDILHIDGRDLIDLPLSDRLAELERVAGSHRIPAVITSNPEVAAKALKKALASGHEGVMVKGVDAPYQAGRRGKSWRKVKPVHTLDLVVLAAEWGHGRRTGWLSNLHLGARRDTPVSEEPDPGEPEFVMVGKTFKGLTDELLRWQTESFPTQMRHHDGPAWDGDKPPPYGTLHLHPHFIVEIALDGAQASTKYPGGVALRFARVRSYRTDKTLAEVDTLSAVRLLLK